MNEPITPKRTKRDRVKTSLFAFRIPDVLISEMDNCAEELGSSRAEFIRAAVREYILKTQRSVYGYTGNAIGKMRMKKARTAEERTRRIAYLSTLPGEQLVRHLIKIKFIPNVIVDGDRVEAHEIRDTGTESGKRELWYGVGSRTNAFPPYESLLMTVDEAIAAIDKEGKLFDGESATNTDSATTTEERDN